MKDVIGIAEMLGEWKAWQVIDVRSPGEFRAGHIPGAVNIPLFSDEERAVVGTLYKQRSPESAFQEGLRIAGAKMPDLVEALIPIKNDTGKAILMHCWRGGKRSQAMQWLYTFSGIECARLEGGYKSFRQALQSFFIQNPFTLKILGGCTGAGKTEVLNALTARGEQVIDLENLAHHKGSAFGSIGEEEQPSTEQFENDLFLAFLALDPQRPVWLENESRSIGRVYLPEGLWHQIKSSVLHTIEVDQEIRLERSMKYYCHAEHMDMLKTAFEKIQKRLGGMEYQLAIKALEARDLKTAARIALRYYDKSYTFQLKAWPPERVVYLTDCNNVQETADRLLRIPQAPRRSDT